MSNEEVEPRSPHDYEEVAVSMERAAESGRWVHVVGYCVDGKIEVHCTTNEFPTSEFSGFMKLTRDNIMKCLQWDISTKQVGTPEHDAAVRMARRFEAQSLSAEIGELPIKGKK